ncbi:MAG TPA: Gfo/Idh/MocA family oxidoreductase [Planctomycetota bacterium]|nr:Gfo/Idh/MocA family oxidoreductase [Planctomycetota bacterium]
MQDSPTAPASQSSVSRRRFLGTAALAVTAPSILPRGLLGQKAPSERILTGHVGLGGRGLANLTPFAKDRAIALCDVDSKHLTEARAKIPREREIGLYADYRKLLDRKDVDAVVVSTPDHWHALPTIHACLAGKHVYVEKPLTLTIAEGRAMVKAARAAKTIVQAGSQQRSATEFRRACELVRNGLIGELKEITVGIPGVNFAGPPVPDAEPPPELDYDFWLGPAPRRPYNEKRVHYLFRFFWDYSGGQQTNWGAHHIDIAQWGHGTDGSGPVEVEGSARFHAQGWFEVPETYELTYKYADGVVLRVGSSLRHGTTFVGSAGRIFVNRGKLEAEPAEMLKVPEDSMRVKLPRSPGHVENWEECIRTGERPICDVEIGHRSATVCHVGNIAIRLGRKLRWDPEKEEFSGDAEAQAMTSRALRAPWKLPS